MDTITTIREFLALPMEALPRAEYLDSIFGDDDPASEAAWNDLRAVLAKKRDMSYVGSKIRVTADRDGWRDGMIIHIEKVP